MQLYEIVTTQTGWGKLPRGVLRIEGRDAAKWLHKIVTANVEPMKTGRGAYSALLDARGHFVADFVLLRDGEAFGALVEPTARDALYETLKRYILREKVTLTDASARWSCFTLVGNQAASVVERLLETRAPEKLYDWEWGHVGETAARVVRMARARVPAYDLMVPLSAESDVYAGLKEIPELPNELLETLRIEAGLPRWGIDFDETTLPLEVPDVLQIRVDQGCYVGQEVVARIVHRGHVNRHLRGLMIESNVPPTRGQAIQLEGADVGIVTSATHSPMFGAIALGYVRRHVAPGAQVKLNDVTARVVELPFKT
ncbi:MAG: folate-binding protein YgfZ [Chloroflexi bacterium]|nr:folate-binding protein YgfZ [Chloroflexota bacterium]